MDADLDLGDLANKWPDLKVCNCQECGKLLQAPDQRGPLEQRHTCAGRPICSTCLRLHPHASSVGTPFATPFRDGDEASPWQENAIRDLESN